MQRIVWKSNKIPENQIDYFNKLPESEKQKAGKGCVFIYFGLANDDIAEKTYNSLNRIIRDEEKKYYIDYRKMAKADWAPIPVHFHVNHYKNNMVAVLGFDVINDEDFIGKLEYSSTLYRRLLDMVLRLEKEHNITIEVGNDSKYLPIVKEHFERGLDLQKYNERIDILLDIAL